MRRPGLRIVFTRRETNYAQYREFARFVATAGTGLLLVYEPYAGAVFYRRVRLRALTKGERNRVGWLEIPMEVNALTPWFLPYDVRFELSSLEGALRYDVGRFDSGGVFTNTQAGEFGAAVQPEGTEPGSLQLRFTGAVSAPVLTLTGLQTGAVYGRCALEYTLVSGDVLEYSSRPADSFCRLIRGGQTVPMDDWMDPASDPWLRVPTTEPCDLRLSGQGISGTAAVTVNYYYSTV